MNRTEYFWTPSTGTIYQNYDINHKKKIAMKYILEQFLPCMEFKCLQPSCSSSYLQHADFCCRDYQFFCAKATSHWVNQLQLSSQTPAPASARSYHLYPCTPLWCSSTHSLTPNTSATNFILTGIFSPHFHSPLLRICEQSHPPTQTTPSHTEWRRLFKAFWMVIWSLWAIRLHNNFRPFP